MLFLVPTHTRVYPRGESPTLTRVPTPYPRSEFFKDPESHRHRLASSLRAKVHKYFHNKRRCACPVARPQSWPEHGPKHYLPSALELAAEPDLTRVDDSAFGLFFPQGLGTWDVCRRLYRMHAGYEDFDAGLVDEYLDMIGEDIDRDENGEDEVEDQVQGSVQARGQDGGDAASIVTVIRCPVQEDDAASVMTVIGRPAQEDDAASIKTVIRRPIQDDDAAPTKTVTRHPVERNDSALFSVLL